MSKVLCFLFSIAFAEFAAAAGIRQIRSTGNPSASAYSFSSSGGGSGSLSGTGGGGGGLPYSSPYSGVNPGMPFPNFVFPGPSFFFPNPGFPNYMDPYNQWLNQNQLLQQHAALHNAQMASILAQQQALAARQHALAQNPTQLPNVDANALDVRTGSTSSTGVSSEPGTSDSGMVFTAAGISVGPQGGQGEAYSFPGGPDGLGTRIGEEFGPPNAKGTFGVFSSSSSGSTTIDGKTTSFKTSTYGKNEDGKITFKTINE